MSRFDDEYESDRDDFDSPEKTDSVIRELRTEIIRLEAQLDQLTASVREQSEESAIIVARLAELERAVDRLRARQRHDSKLLVIAWMMVVASLLMSFFTYFAS
ncbi:hypothetical protein VT84_38145 [Gemmata sp. SH-PL17]|uniref:hypothetical protein n=1 Tax=Gemmata sp. SH-PL17 TaxID=1630693 RepID=UPI00078E32C1|nr:hypothetical protein [Gemmata sp. SH-PL17]AMV30277.1 hypothetical protein VT84_38145 [Gemmata sp. SH-PL17]